MMPSFVSSASVLPTLAFLSTFALVSAADCVINSDHTVVSTVTLVSTAIQTSIITSVSILTEHVTVTSIEPAAVASTIFTNAEVVSPSIDATSYYHGLSSVQSTTTLSAAPSYFSAISNHTVSSANNATYHNGSSTTTSFAPSVNTTALSTTMLSTNVNATSTSAPSSTLTVSTTGVPSLIHVFNTTLASVPTASSSLNTTILPASILSINATSTAAPSTSSSFNTTGIPSSTLSFNTSTTLPSTSTTSSTGTTSAPEILLPTLAAVTSATVSTVALPYATYQATHNATYGFQKFSNVRFAAAPTGTLRFKNPVAPTATETAIQDGSYGYTCYQLEQGSNSGAANQGEDCLFLDVIVPDNIPEGTQLPVLYYIYGGGWHTGQKELYEGSGLVIASDNSVIYVVSNYRLGAFGFLGDFGDINPGIADQAFAMEWIQSYIHLFGGDPTRVTAAGHSAGAGSMLAHLISNGGQGSIPFQQGVIMSPAAAPMTVDSIYERNQEMLNYFGYESYSQEQMEALTAQQVNDMTGHIGAAFGPVVDGSYIQEFPSKAFAGGRFHGGIPLITGQLADEAHDFIPTTSPFIIDGDSNIRDMQYDTKELMTTFLADSGYNMSSDQIDQAWALYPTINNTDLYYTIFGKYDTLLSEILLDCYSYYMAKGYSTVYGWFFDVPPAYHAQENPYLFAGGTGNGGTSSYPINATLSAYMKEYLVNFVKGDINGGANTPITWQPWSASSQVIELGNDNVGMIADPANNARCAFWENNTQ